MTVLRAIRRAKTKKGVRCCWVFCGTNLKEVRKKKVRKLQAIRLKFSGSRNSGSTANGRAGADLQMSVPSQDVAGKE